MALRLERSAIPRFSGTHPSTTRTPDAADSRVTVLAVPVDAITR